MRASESPMRAPAAVVVEPLRTSTRATRPFASITATPAGAFGQTAYVQLAVLPENPPPTVVFACAIV
jgi:hypothetical protein